MKKKRVIDGLVTPRTLTDWLVKERLSDDEVFTALSTKKQRLEQLFKAHGQSMRDIKLPAIPAHPAEYGPRNRSLWCVRCDATVNAAGDGWYRHLLSDRCKNFRTSKGTTYAVKD